VRLHCVPSCLERLDGGRQEREGIGIPPDDAVQAAASDFRAADRVQEVVLTRLRGEAVPATR